MESQKGSDLGIKKILPIDNKHRKDKNLFISGYTVERNHSNQDKRLGFYSGLRI